jgi:hypothetical protein
MERSAASLLDMHRGVKKWVKNDRLGFSIPCHWQRFADSLSQRFHGST